MVNIGINGFGRIGKSLFLQLLDHKYITIKAINIPDFNINYLETYLLNDSVHHYNKKWELKIIDETTFKINNKTIKILNSRDANKLNWKAHGITYVIDATGVYLTMEKAEKHNVDYVIMCAPAKDNTPTFVVNGNHNEYKGEKIVSNASCTTNCIIPVLKFLNDKYKISSANFTTIHATTASQNTTDTIKFKNRTCRSIINNIIPHSTGASSSISKIIPELKGKIHGTSLRIPVSNVSLVDLNVNVENKTNLQEILEEMEKTDYLQVESSAFLVSSDFNTTTCPSIIDTKASMEMQENQFKLMVWYDNEWSYCAKTIKLLEHMHDFNKIKKQNKYFIENYNFKDKRVVLRLDWNIPIQNSEIVDYFRIDSSLKTLKYILRQDPKYIVILTHLGRPKKGEKDEKLSWKTYLDQINTRIQEKCGTKINLLTKGLHKESLNNLSENLKSTKVFLLENIRFHQEETKQTEDSQEIKQIYDSLGDIYVNDAFACSHRDHLSITGCRDKERAFGYLINREVNCLSSIVKNINNDKILAIIGGGKMDDKLPLLESLSKNVDGIYIAGGNINSILKNTEYSDYIKKIENQKAEIHLMSDGLASQTLEISPNYETNSTITKDKNFFDIGMQSIVDLNNLIKEYDVIFWNGTLGVVENELYSYGSTTLVNILMKSNKKVIIGGGDTAGFVNKFNHNFYYVSTGGGASLEYLSHHELIGLKQFQDDNLTEI